MIFSVVQAISGNRTIQLFIDRLLFGIKGVGRLLMWNCTVTCIYYLNKILEWQGL